MSGRARRLRSGLVAALAAAVGVLGAPAWAADHHQAGEHPRPVELAEPAIVSVVVSAAVNIVLIEHRSELTLVRRTYTTPTLSHATGVGVNPNGIVVTDPDALTVNEKMVGIYAANRVFADYYRLPSPRDPFVPHTLANADLNKGLQECYAVNSAHSTCLTFVTPLVRVFPYVSSGPSVKGLVAERLKAGTSDVGVLQVGARNVPTVALNRAGPAGTAGEVTALGFEHPYRVGDEPATVQARLDPSGAQVEAEHVGMLRAQLGSGLPGAPVLGADGRLLGLLRPRGDRALSVIPVSHITTALAAAGLSPSRGPVDSTFAEALDFYRIQHYAHAAESFAEVVKLDPGQAIAVRDGKDADAKKNGPLDKSDVTHREDHQVNAGPSSGSRSSAAPLIAGGLAILAVAGVLVALLRRRRSSAPAPGTSAAPPVAPVAYVGAPAPRVPASAGLRAAPAAPVQVVTPDVSAAPAPAVPAGRAPDSPQPSVAAAPAGNAAAAPDAGEPVRPPARTAVPMEITGPFRGARRASPAPPAHRHDAPVAVAEAGPATDRGQTSLRAVPAAARATVVIQPVCANCGKSLKPGSRFCGGCGSPQA